MMRRIEAATVTLHLAFVDWHFWHAVPKPRNPQLATFRLMHEMHRTGDDE
jgi:hypothetical protein